MEWLKGHPTSHQHTPHPQRRLNPPISTHHTLPSAHTTPSHQHTPHPPINTHHTLPLTHTTLSHQHTPHTQYRPHFQHRPYPPISTHHTLPSAHTHQYTLTVLFNTGHQCRQITYCISNGHIVRLGKKQSRTQTDPPPSSISSSLLPSQPPPLNLPPLCLLFYLFRLAPPPKGTSSYTDPSPQWHQLLH